GTYASPNPNGWVLTNPNKTFTIRAAEDAVVVLDGGNARQIVSYLVDNLAQQGNVKFERLTFRNGRSTTAARSGAFTQQAGRTGFVECTFENNFSSQGGGAYWGYGGAVSHFVDSLFQNNTSNGSGAGARFDTGAQTWIHGTTFLNNKNNIVGGSNLAV